MVRVILPAGNRRAPESDSSDSTAVSSSGVVMYQGAVLELDKVMAKLDRSEHCRLEVEKQAKQLQRNIGTPIHPQTIRLYFVIVSVSSSSIYISRKPAIFSSEHTYTSFCLFLSLQMI